MDLINNIFGIIAAAGADAAGKQSIAEQFGFDWTKLFAQVLTFVAVWFILKWKAYGPILEMLEKRKQRIEELRQEITEIENDNDDLEKTITELLDSFG